MIEYRLWSKGRQEQPELPQRPLEAPVSDFNSGPHPADRPFENGPGEGPLGADEAQLIRARRLASAARDAGLDDDLRADLIDYWTFGETRSSKDLSDQQAQKLFQVIQQIRTGKTDIRYNEEGKLYLEDAKSGKRYR